MPRIMDENIPKSRTMIVKFLPGQESEWLWISQKQSSELNSQWGVLSKFWRKIICNLKFYTLPNYLPSICIKLGYFQTARCEKHFHLTYPLNQGGGRHGYMTQDILNSKVQGIPRIVVKECRKSAVSKLGGQPVQTGAGQKAPVKICRRK